MKQSQNPQDKPIAQIAYETFVTGLTDLSGTAPRALPEWQQLSLDVQEIFVVITWAVIAAMHRTAAQQQTQAPS